MSQIGMYDLYHMNMHSTPVGQLLLFAEFGMSYVNAFLCMVLRGVYLAHKTLSVMHYNNICMVPGSVLNKAHDKEKSAKSYPSDVHATKQSQNLLKCGCVKWQERKKSFHWFGRKKMEFMSRLRTFHWVFFKLRSIFNFWGFFREKWITRTKNLFLLDRLLP